MSTKTSIYICCAMTAGLLSPGGIQKAEAQSDFGVWMDAGVEKELGKHWTLEGGLGARTRNNSREMDRYSLGVALATS